MQQKSQINWLRSRDNNIKVFHSFANSHKPNNRFSSLIIDGSECEDLQRIENEIIEYCKRFYSKNQKREAWVSSWMGKNLSVEQAASLEDLLMRRKLKSAVFLLSAKKAKV